MACRSQWCVRVRYRYRWHAAAILATKRYRASLYGSVGDWAEKALTSQCVGDGDDFKCEWRELSKRAFRRRRSMRVCWPIRAWATAAADEFDPAGAAHARSSARHLPWRRRCVRPPRSSCWCARARPKHSANVAAAGSFEYPNARSRCGPVRDRYPANPRRVCVYFICILYRYIYILLL